MEKQKQLIEKLKELVQCYRVSDWTKIDKLESEIASLDDSKDEIKHGIPFNCPECGKEIQYGLSDEGNKLFATSRLFRKEMPAGAEEILLNKQIAISHDFDGLMYGAKKHEVIEAMEEYATVKEALQINKEISIDEMKNEGIKYLQSKYPDKEILTLPDIQGGDEFVDFVMGLQVGHHLALQSTPKIEAEGKEIKSAEEMLLAKCSENKVFLTSNEIHTIIEAMLEYSRQGESDTVTDDYKAKYEKCISVINRFDPGIIGMYDL